MTPAAFARQVGLSREAIRQAMDAGRIPFVTVSGRRMIEDPAAAEKALHALTDQEQSLRGDGNKSGGRGVWVDAKSATERIKAELLGLELEELKGELVRKADVEREIGGMLSNLRDQLLSVPDRCAAEVSAAKSQAEIARIIDRVVREAMRLIGTKQSVVS